MSVDLEALGICKEDLLAKVVDKISEDIWWDNEEVFIGKVQDRIRERVDEAVDALAEEHVLPRVDEFIKTVTLQETNRWGEKIGKPTTLIEYLTQRAEAYLLQPVDFNGDPKKSNSGWDKQDNTRLSWMVDKHFRHQIEIVANDLSANIRPELSKALTETVRLKLEEMVKAISVGVITK